MCVSRQMCRMLCYLWNLWIFLFRNFCGRYFLCLLAKVNKKKEKNQMEICRNVYLLMAESEYFAIFFIGMRQILDEDCFQLFIFSHIFEIFVECLGLLNDSTFCSFSMNIFINSIWYLLNLFLSFWPAKLIKESIY